MGGHSLQVRGRVQYCRMRPYVQVVCPGVKPHSAVCRGGNPYCLNLGMLSPNARAQPDHPLPVCSPPQPQSKSRLTLSGL